MPLVISSRAHRVMDDNIAVAQNSRNIKDLVLSVSSIYATPGLLRVISAASNEYDEISEFRNTRIISPYTTPHLLIKEPRGHAPSGFCLSSIRLMCLKPPCSLPHRHGHLIYDGRAPPILDARQAAHFRARVLMLYISCAGCTPSTMSLIAPTASRCTK